MAHKAIASVWRTRIWGFTKRGSADDLSASHLSSILEWLRCRTSVCADCEIAGTGHGTRRATSLDHHVRRFGWTCVYTYNEAKDPHSY